ncbi:MAG: MFS transporter [Candidatus Hodarchaeota archaeon]
MSTSNSLNSSKFSISRHFWSMFLLAGFQSLAFGGFIILVVPLSFIIWPNDPYHALEIGILVASLFWIASLGGVIFGILIDRFNRTKIIFFISIFRGFSMIMLGFAVEGKGFETWLYFLVYVLIFAFFTGGSWPSIVSISNDIVPKLYRSRFFGAMGIMMGLFTTFGFLVASAFVQYGYWRLYFWWIGISIIIAGFIFFIHVNEPKRGSQQEELIHILKDDSIEYNFQIDRKTMKKTMLSKTNVVALIEGISTNILMGSLYLLVLPYIQTEPHNLSPVFTGLFLIVFGLTGGLLGQFFLAKLSDKVAENRPISRIYFIIIALSVDVITFVVLFFIPLPYLTVEQGRDIPYLFSIPMIWIWGTLLFTSSIISSLYLVNQAPLLQEINLPEAQGKITSWNQLVENIGFGAGPLIVGILLSISGVNYQLTVIIISLLIIPGILLWFSCLRWYPQDKQVIKSILKERAEALKSRHNNSPMKN